LKTKPFLPQFLTTPVRAKWAQKNNHLFGLILGRGAFFVQGEFPKQYAASLAKINPGNTVRVSGCYKNRMVT